MRMRLNLAPLLELRKVLCFLIENDNVIEWGCLSSPGLKKAGSLGEVVYKNFKKVKKIGACHLNATVLAGKFINYQMEICIFGDRIMIICSV